MIVFDDGIDHAEWKTGTIGGRTYSQLTAGTGRRSWVEQERSFLAVPTKVSAGIGDDIDAVNFLDVILAGVGYYELRRLVA